MNYRGISLLSVVAKVFSSILNNRLTDYLENNDILVEEQNGFRKNRSYEDHVLTLNSVIQNRNSTFVTFIDSHKAFDTVDRDLLEYCLLQNGVGGNFNNIPVIKAIYQNTESCVRIGNNMTEWFPCN